MNIILIGFMGAGKSTVAKILAEKLNFDLVEMDDYIIKHSKLESVNEIFARFGEIHFREMEIITAKKIYSLNSQVISCGGGVVMNKIIIDYLKKNGRVFYLKTAFDTLSKRLVGDNSRPLFKDKIKAKELYDFRQILYEKYADFIIDTNKKTPIEVVNSLLKLIK